MEINKHSKCKKAASWSLVDIQALACAELTPGTWREGRSAGEPPAEIVSSMRGKRALGQTVARVSRPGNPKTEESGLRARRRSASGGGGRAGAVGGRVADGPPAVVGLSPSLPFFKVRR